MKGEKTRMSLGVKIEKYLKIVRPSKKNIGE